MLNLLLVMQSPDIQSDYSFQRTIDKNVLVGAKLFPKLNLEYAETSTVF